MADTDGALSAKVDGVKDSVDLLRTEVRDNAKTYLTKAEYEASKQGAEAFIQALSERVRKIEDRSEWLVRTVGGVIITAIITAFLVLSKTHGGG